MTPRIENPADYEFSILDSFFFEPKTTREAPTVIFLLIKEKKKNLTGIYREV